MWFFSTLGFLFSVPGQTMGMAVFTDPFIDALGLSRTQLSMAYLVGTVSSALFLTQAGRWYDRLGGRIMIAGSSLCLGVMVAYISFADRIAGALGGTVSVAFVAILLGYFGVRFFGQGVLTSASRNVLLVWFVKRRGLVSGVRGVFVSLGFSLAPLLLAWLIAAFGWRGALWAMALVVGLLFPALAIVFIRNNPQECGLLPDGEPGEPSDSPAADTESVELSTARRSPVFWIYCLSLSMHAMFGTALTFHIVSIFEAAGRSREEAFGYFFPSAVFSTTANLIASYLVDLHSLKPFLVMMLALFMIGATGLYNLDKPWGFWVLAGGFGAGGGLWGVISNLCFIRFFGPLYLGEISGFNASLTVFGSAIGPAAFALGLDAFGGYDVPVALCLVLLGALLVAAIVIRQEELSSHPPRRQT
ncbi:MAG: MFS transporter [Pseudomonadales bacterium]|nr:MFS transporter [Pseudomonadales bacterium]